MSFDLNVTGPNQEVTFALYPGTVTDAQAILQRVIILYFTKARTYFPYGANVFGTLGQSNNSRENLTAKVTAANALIRETIPELRQDAVSVEIDGDKAEVTVAFQDSTASTTISI